MAAEYRLPGGSGALAHRSWLGRARFRTCAATRPDASTVGAEPPRLAIGRAKAAGRGVRWVGADQGEDASRRYAPEPPEPPRASVSTHICPSRSAVIPSATSPSWSSAGSVDGRRLRQPVGDPDANAVALRHRIRGPGILIVPVTVAHSPSKHSAWPDLHVKQVLIARHHSAAEFGADASTTLSQADDRVWVRVRVRQAGRTRLTLRIWPR